jgi:hypothetical protein
VTGKLEKRLGTGSRARSTFENLPNEPMEPNDELLQDLEITEDDLEINASSEKYTTMCGTFRDLVIQFKETEIDRLYTRPIAAVNAEFKETESTRPISAINAEFEENKKRPNKET